MGEVSAVPAQRLRLRVACSEGRGSQEPLNSCTPPSPPGGTGKHSARTTESRRSRTYDFTLGSLDPGLWLAQGALHPKLNTPRKPALRCPPSPQPHRRIGYPESPARDGDP